jgi:hypothetical protein
MAIILTHAAAIVAGLAIIASPFMIARSGLLHSLVASVGLALVAAAIIHALAS